MTDVMMKVYLGSRETSERVNILSKVLHIYKYKKLFGEYLQKQEFKEK